MNFPLKIMKYTQLAAVLLLSGPVSADKVDLPVLFESLDCMNLAKKERDRMLSATGSLDTVALSNFLFDCKIANDKAETAVMQKQISMLRKHLLTINLRIDENLKIIDEHDRVIGRLKRDINGIKLKILESKAEQRAMLKQAAAILNELARY